MYQRLFRGKRLLIITDITTLYPSLRSEPNSRTTLIGEQPNPWELLHPQDVMSRHRGAKQFRR